MASMLGLGLIGLSLLCRVSRAALHFKGDYSLALHFKGDYSLAAGKCSSGQMQGATEATEDPVIGMWMPSLAFKAPGNSDHQHRSLMTFWN